MKCGANGSPKPPDSITGSFIRNWWLDWRSFFFDAFFEPIIRIICSFPPNLFGPCQLFVTLLAPCDGCGPLLLNATFGGRGALLALPSSVCFGRAPPLDGCGSIKASQQSSCPSSGTGAFGGAAGWSPPNCKCVFSSAPEPQSLWEPLEGSWFLMLRVPFGKAEEKED